MDNLVKGVQCYELIVGISLKNHAFLSLFPSFTITLFILLKVNFFLSSNSFKFLHVFSTAIGLPMPIMSSTYERLFILISGPYVV